MDSAPLVVEAAESSITKPVVSESVLGVNTTVSLKSKVTGLFPNGSLSTKKKCSSKSLTEPNKVSAVNLMEFGSIIGLSFPS